MANLCVSDRQPFTRGYKLEAWGMVNFNFNVLPPEKRVDTTPLGQLDTLATILHSDNTLLLPNSARVKAAQNVRIIWEVSRRRMRFL